jgi:hypothetical protein
LAFVLLKHDKPWIEEQPELRFYDVNLIPTNLTYDLSFQSAFLTMLALLLPGWPGGLAHMLWKTLKLLFCYQGTAFFLII